MAGQAAERKACIAQAEKHGWRPARHSKKGYVLMYCSCGEHQETLHKSPSNPDHFKLKLAKMARDCSSQRLGK